MRRLFATALAVAVIVTACSEPPDKERQQAEGAIAAARAADAATYAPAELAAAQAALDKYDAAVSDRDYRQALSLAVEARDGAYRAAKDASDGKAAARSQAERLASDLETLTKVADARLAGAGGPKLSPPAVEHLRAAVKPSAALLQEARSDIARQDYKGAIAALSPAVAALRAEVAGDASPAAHKVR